MRKNSFIDNYFVSETALEIGGPYQLKIEYLWIPLAQRQRLRCACAARRSVLFKMNLPEADLKYSIFSRKYSIL